MGKSQNKKRVDGDKLRGLIRQYKEKDEPTLLRNKIFDLMHPGIMVIVKGILSKWGRFEDETEIVSLSWDCFLFSISKYDFDNYQVWPHFRRYSKYFLLLHYSNEQAQLKKDEYLKDFGDVFSEFADEGSNIEEIKRFREALPLEEQEIFDNVIFGDHPPAYKSGEFQKKKDRSGGISYYRYYTLKETFKRLIKHLIK